MNSKEPATTSGYTCRLSGWGRFPVVDSNVVRLESISQHRELFHQEDRARIPRGLGRSYGDAALLQVGLTLDECGRNRLLELNETTGRLNVEAGTSLAEINSVIEPRGWSLPVVPGTEFVTVGGAIAADIHGKNHHRAGSFSQHLKSLEMMLANGEIFQCSREDNADLFHATVGGMGLTGVILSAAIKLKAIPTQFCNVKTLRTRNFEQTYEALRKSEAEYEYSVAWVDCLSRGKNLGRGIVMCGNDASPEEVADARVTPRQGNRSWISIPNIVPPCLLNRYSIALFNQAYYWCNRTGQRIVPRRKFFYPLDSIANWNRLYGPRGFVQFQALLPPASSEAGMKRLLITIVERRHPSFLAVLKTMGPQSEGVLGFGGPGLTLALDFPWNGETTRSLLNELHNQVAEQQGRVYLAKDATLDAGQFRRMYPALDHFRELKAHFDPENRFQSEQSKRLGLT